MKQKNTLTWAISAVIYLGLVIGGYTVYASLDSNDDHINTHTATTNVNEEKESINEQTHNYNHTSQRNDGKDSAHSEVK
ncbi:hypothetical protein [Metabacillus bambusae]|uniref:Uncharacterized protein n=1 Tax=Metabacillus bambusae TaxID=2795218 RepID=A0ABS3MZ55_9BACI|nr:hypothetical protein [Metabacillus bambusae]MBO1511306.1 hypothetical protein [Metabacillus bambusae]